MRSYFWLFILLAQICNAQVKTYSGKPISDAELKGNIKKAMESMHVAGMSVAVINDGKVVFNEGLGYANLKRKKEVTNTTFFEAASMSKPLFAYYTLQLAREGKLDLDKPLAEYLPYPDIDDERYKEITARMVLSHTSGLPNWRETGRMKLSTKPGTQFSYSGEGYLYLAKVIAHITGNSLQTLDKDFQREIARPSGLKNLHFVVTPESAENVATGYQDTKEVKDERDRLSFDPAGGLYANSTNFAAFLTTLMNHQSLYPEMFKPVIDLKEDEVVRQYFGVEAWTVGLALIRVNGSVNYWHGGNNLGYTSSFMINSEKKFGYVFLTNSDQCNGMKKVLEKILWQ